MLELASTCWRTIRQHLFVCLTSPKTSGKRMVGYHQKVIILPCLKGTVAICPKQSFQSASAANNFCWVFIILRHPYSRLLFTFWLMRIHPLRSFETPSLDTSIFLKILSNYVESHEQETFSC